MILHVGLFLFFAVSLRANYKIPVKTSEFILVDLMQEEQEIPTPQIEPTPQPTAKPTPKVSEETIQKLQDKLKTPTPTRKAKPTKTPTAKPTRTPRPTKTPTKKPAPTPTAKSVATPTPVSPEITKIPLSAMPQTAASQVKSVTNLFSIQGLDDSAYNFSSYGAILTRQLSRAWRQPRTPPKRQEYSTVVTFTVYRDGSISNIEILQSSGWRMMDESVLAALHEASPVEPLPYGYKANSIRVTAPFRKPIE